jgi:hypothetical protein
MKKLSLLSVLFITLTVQATIRTVSNNPATIAQYNTIQSAIDASAAGDTILVHGSPNTYTGFTISDKKLTIIGPGWRPDKNLPHVANVNTTITLSGTASSGTELQGLTISGGNIIIATHNLNNIRFIRNRVIYQPFSITPPGTGTISGYLFEGNYFDDGKVNSNNSQTLQNFIFQNNIFYLNDCCSSYSISGFFNTINVLFDHNLFYGLSGVNNVFSASDCRFLLLTNNIFVRRNAANAISTTFSNNLTFNTSNNTPWTANGNVDGGGNIANQDPQMVSQASINGGSSDPLYDFTIPVGPANNSATDGKDIGLLYDISGSLNWANSRNSRIPRIAKMNITNPTVAVGGSVTVSVEARTSN